MNDYDRYIKMLDDFSIEYALSNESIDNINFYNVKNASVGVKTYGEYFYSIYFFDNEGKFIKQWILE